MTIFNFLREDDGVTVIELGLLVTICFVVCAFSAMFLAILYRLFVGF